MIFRAITIFIINPRTFTILIYKLLINILIFSASNYKHTFVNVILTHHRQDRDQNTD